MDSQFNEKHTRIKNTFNDHGHVFTEKIRETPAKGKEGISPGF